MELLEIHDVLVSIWRWTAGLIAGSLAGLCLALVASFIGLIREPLMTAAGFLRALPILALVPLIQWSLGIGEWQKVLLICWACFFPVFVSTIRSAGRRFPDLELRIRSVKMTTFQRFKHYDAPRILFGFISGVEISIGIGWLTVVAAETIGTFNNGAFRGGLGQAVFVAFENGNFGVGLLCLGIFGTLGSASVLLWAQASAGLVHLVGFDRKALTAT